MVRLRLIENDYAILRAYSGRAGFATYISIVVQRMALDYRVHEWGKWHVSAEAKRLGPLAVELDQLLHRDGRTLDEAAAILGPKYEGATPAALASLAARFPERAPRRRAVAIEEAEQVAVLRAEDVEEPLLAKERKYAAETLSAVLARAIRALPEDDRLILQLRFESGMTVAQIARALQIDQKLLYRRIERCMREMRTELERSGIEAASALDLIGRDETSLDFALGNLPPRPSMSRDERAAPSEGSS